MEEQKNRTLGPYILVRLLARGGMSEVYLAVDESRDRTYALKVVRRTNAEHYARFQQELRAQSQFDHPRILPLLDEGEQDGLAYAVLPYIQHGTLKEHLAQGFLTSAEAGEILSQLANALHAMHLLGLVHRDIKPANILRDEQNHVWLADFGLTKEFDAGSDLTDTGELIGTPFYMAPELVNHSASPGSDIYALGVVLYEMLTGRVPFKGKTPIAICWQHMHAAPPSPSSLNPAVTSVLETVLMRALEKDPHARFTSASEFAEAYQKALSATHADEREDTSADSATSMVLPISHIKGLCQRRRHLSRPLVAALALLAVGAMSLGIISGAQLSTVVSHAPHIVNARQTASSATPEIPIGGIAFVSSVGQTISASPMQHPVQAQPPAHRPPMIRRGSGKNLSSLGRPGKSTLGGSGKNSSISGRPGKSTSSGSGKDSSSSGRPGKS